MKTAENTLRPAAPTPEIQAELQRLEQTLTRLQQANAALMTKLEPVMDLTTTAIEVSIAEAGPLTALGKYVRTLDNIARAEVDSILAITDSVAF